MSPEILMVVSKKWITNTPSETLTLLNENKITLIIFRLRGTRDTNDDNCYYDKQRKHNRHTINVPLIT